MHVYVLMKSTQITLSCPPLNSTAPLPLSYKSLLTFRPFSLTPTEFNRFVWMPGWVGFLLRHSYNGLFLPGETSRFSSISDFRIWKMIVMINLIGYRINKETSLWACLWKIILG